MGTNYESYYNLTRIINKLNSAIDDYVAALSEIREELAGNQEYIKREGLEDAVDITEEDDEILKNTKGLTKYMEKHQKRIRDALEQALEDIEEPEAD